MSGQIAIIGNAWRTLKRNFYSSLANYFPAVLVFFQAPGKTEGKFLTLSIDPAKQIKDPMGRRPTYNLANRRYSIGVLLNRHWWSVSRNRSTTSKLTRKRTVGKNMDELAKAGDATSRNFNTELIMQMTSNAGQCCEWSNRERYLNNFTGNYRHRTPVALLPFNFTPRCNTNAPTNSHLRHG